MSPVDANPSKAYLDVAQSPPTSGFSHIGFTVLDADDEIHKMLVKLRADLQAVVEAIQALELMEQERRSKHATKSSEPKPPARRTRRPKIIDIASKR